jgi:hypothetical protein
MDDPLTPANDTIVRGDVLPGGAAGEVPMADNMSQISATANAHMRRDIEAGGKWACQCEACHELRSLIGMEKVLNAMSVRHTSGRNGQWRASQQRLWEVVVSAGCSGLFWAS